MSATPTDAANSETRRTSGDPIADEILAEEFAILESLRESVKTNWTPHTPSPRQQLFLELNSLEAMFGGAAGGGKSDALLMAALQYVDEPGYAAIIFRKSLTDLALPEALIPRSHEWLAQTPAVWHEKEAGGVPGRTWKFPSGATLTFAYLDSSQDKYRYQSSAYQFIGFDELTQFPEDNYLYLFSRLRRLVGSNVPLRMRSASNPGGEGHEWVKARFIPEDYTKDQAGEAKVWSKTTLDDEDREVSTSFVPSRIQDNQHLEQESYIEGLGKLGRVAREQLLHGDWAISPTGECYFNYDALSRYVSKAPAIGELIEVENELGEKSLIFSPRPDGRLAIWSKPQRGHCYVMGCDTASGKDANRGEGRVSRDWSVCQVFDIDSGEQVARYRGQVSERWFGETWARLSRWYNGAYVVPAVTGGYGRASLNRALDCGLPVSVVYQPEDETGLQGKRLAETSVDLGFVETVATRPTLYSLCDLAVIQQAITLYDAVTINECFSFEYNKDGKPEARTGTKDDCVTALALAVRGIKAAPMWLRAKVRQQAGIAQFPGKYGGQSSGTAEQARMRDEARRRNSVENARRMR